MTGNLGKKAIPLGPTGAAVAKNLTRLRKARGMTVRSLSAALAKAGRPLSPDAITRFENAARVGAAQIRRVDVDDLVALAAVLRVNPTALLLPLEDAPDAVIEVAGAGLVPADVAWDWMDGTRPLEVPDGDPDTALLDFALYSRPRGRRALLAKDPGRMSH